MSEAGTPRPIRLSGQPTRPHSPSLSRRPIRRGSRLPPSAVAAENGYVDQADGSGFPQVTSQVLSQVEVRVTIETEGESFFGKVVLDNIDIERYAQASLARPIPMGNPTSALGTGVDPEYPGRDADNFWLNVWDDDVGRQSGGSLTAATSNGSTTNELFDPLGYLYAIRVPPSGGNYEIQVRMTCASDGVGRLELSLYPPENSVSPNFLRDNVEVPLVPEVALPKSNYSRPGTAVCPSDYADFDSRLNAGLAPDPAPWETVYNIGAQSGDWVLQAEHGGGGNRTLYSLRVIDASQSGVARHCTTFSDPDCPAIRPVNTLGAYTDPDPVRPELHCSRRALPHRSPRGQCRVPSSRSTCSTRRTASSRCGSSCRPAPTLRRARRRTVSTPRFTWNTVGESGFIASPVYNLTCPVGPTTVSCVKSPSGNPQSDLNNRQVKIVVDLASIDYDGDGTIDPYTCQTDCWWKVEYEYDTNSNLNEETTGWYTQIVGDPIRLTG